MSIELNQFLKIHALVGMSALITFWIAALSKKGGKRHILAGRIYLISMAFVLISTIPIIIHFLEIRDFNRAMTLIYLFFVTFSGMLLLFRPMRMKGSPDKYKSLFYVLWGTFMTGFAGLILYLGIINPLLVKQTLMFGFSSIGFFIGLSMLHFYFNKNSVGWWINQHLNGAMVVFAATHASFFGLGLRKLLPVLAGDWMHTLTQVTIIFLAFFIRWVVGNRHSLRERNRRPVLRGMID